MPFQIIRNDITKVRADAIVNTANPNPVYADGTDAAIYRAAGAQKLLAERKKIGRIRPGEVAVTPAFALRAKFIIHTVGPVWQDGSHGEYSQLASCYRKSLLIARQLGCESIAFPLISTGVYGFPKDRALDIALKEISDFLEISEMQVTLVVFDRRAFELSTELAADVGQYIDDHYVKAQEAREYSTGSFYRDEPEAAQDQPYYAPQRRRMDSLPPHNDYLSAAGDFAEESSSFQAPSVHSSMPRPDASVRPAHTRRAGSNSKKRSLDDVISQAGESFQTCLLRLIDEHGFTDAEVYKRANIDRKLFSKIRCNPNYTPGRKTVISLAIALQPNMDEMTDLLRKAGIALSPGNKFDLIIRYCVENQIYDPMKINALLFDYGQDQLGA